MPAADLKPQRYKETRPRRAVPAVHEWSRTHQPNWVYEFVRLITDPGSRCSCTAPAPISAGERPGQTAR